MNADKKNIKNYTVEEGAVGMRLDLYLTFKIPNTPRKTIKEYIYSHKVLVNSQIEFHPQYKLKFRDKIELNLPQAPRKKESPKFLRERKKRENEPELDVIYEDDNVLVINKPSGVVMDHGSGHSDATVADMVREYLAKTGSTLLGDSRLGQIHRLDKETSGLVIYAKTPESLWYLAKQFDERKVTKTYLACVSGLARKTLVATTPIDGKKARTYFTQIQVSEDKQYSFLKAEPLTGRKHQIRIHLSESGFPIVGDKNYGGVKAKRLMLHAYKLKLEIPRVTTKSSRSKEKYIMKEFTAEPDAVFWQELIQKGFTKKFKFHV